MDPARNQQLFAYRRQAVNDEAFSTRANALHTTTKLLKHLRLIVASHHEIAGSLPGEVSG